MVAAAMHANERPHRFAAGHRDGDLVTIRDGDPADGDERTEFGRRNDTDPHSRLDARAHELDLIQTLGRRATQARTPQELFASTVEVLHAGEPLDAALVANAVDGGREIVAFVARPMDEDCLSRIAARAAELLGWTDAAPSPLLRRLESYDDARGARHEFLERDLVVLPITRRDRAVACLVCLPAGRAGEDRLRLLYSAANQLGLHLDRILSAREVEADRFRTILDSMPQAVVLTDRDLRIVQSNRAGRALLARMGHGADGSLVSAVVELGLGPVLEEVREGTRTLADGEITMEGDTAFSVTVSPLADNGGARGGLVVVLTDVTESRRMQRQLANSEKMLSLGQMISGVAHELNNPLTSVLGYAQLLRASAGNADEKFTARLDTLDREARRCRKIVHNLLAFARGREPERRRESLNEIVQSVLGLIGYQLRVAGIEVATDLDGNLPAIEADGHQLQQVLINLLTNAQHAIEESGGPGRVEISTRVDGDAVTLVICDDGPGIPQALRERVFEPFFTTKSEGKGTGLGLSIVYGIVTAHGGEIELPPVEKGACVRIRLPVSPAALESTPHDSGRSEPLSVRCARILVVDDEPSVAQLLCETLSHDGHVTQCAADGQAALDALDAAEFDLIVCDIRMPGMSGERFYEEVRRRRPELCERLLLTTGDTVSDAPERFVTRAGLELLHKPFELDQLRRHVRARLANAPDP